jgi:UDP-3-O-[3-hydroxymyristoyl] N-acetylglucosamine deacetylase
MPISDLFGMYVAHLGRDSIFYGDVMKYCQGTLKRSVKFAGVGLHSGNLVNVEIFPAFQNTGIIFQRTSTFNTLPILANPFNVLSTELNTTIGEGDSSVSTIEHLMAAFAGVGIDNAFIKVDSAEIPILDGSAAPFVDKFREVGIEKQKANRKIFMVNKSFEVRSGDQFVRVEPASSLSIHCEIDFRNSRAIGAQSYHFNFTEGDFSCLHDARTFCHIRDVEAMRSVGLAQGGSLDNAVVVNDEAVINSEGLRYSDEFVRHKLLDFIGDLALMGGQLLGKVYLRKAGHRLHSQFTRELLKNQSDLLTVITQEFEAINGDFHLPGERHIHAIPLMKTAISHS